MALALGVGFGGQRALAQTVPTDQTGFFGLAGIVRNTNGQPINDVRISVKNLSTRRTETATSGSQTGSTTGFYFVALTDFVSNRAVKVGDVLELHAFVGGAEVFVAPTAYVVVEADIDASLRRDVDLVVDLLRIADRVAPTAYCTYSIEAFGPEGPFTAVDVTVTFSEPVTGMLTARLADPAGAVRQVVFPWPQVPIRQLPVRFALSGDSGIYSFTLTGARDLAGNPAEPPRNADFILPPGVGPLIAAGAAVGRDGDEVVVPVTLATFGGPNPGALRFDLSPLPARAATFVKVDAGPVALDSGYSVAASEAASGVVSVVVFGFGELTLSNGIVAWVRYRLETGLPDGTWVRLCVREPLASDLSGETIPGTRGQDGHLQVRSGSHVPVVRIEPPGPAVAGFPITLDARATVDPDGDPLTYAWAVESMPGDAAIRIDGAATPMPCFVGLTAGVYRLRLTAADPGGNRGEGTVNVLVAPAGRNRPPLAVISAPVRAVAWEAVTLDGRLSFDPDGDLLTYSWSQSDGPSLQLGTTTAPVLTLTLQEPGSYGFRLSVRDPEGAEAAAETRLSVWPGGVLSDDHPDFPSQVGFLDRLVLDGPPAVGVVSEARDVDFFGLDLAASQSWELLAIPFPEAATFTLFAPDGATVLDEATGGPPSVVRLGSGSVATGGRHYLRVSSGDGASTGGYLLQAVSRLAARPLPPRLTVRLEPGPAGSVEAVLVSSGPASPVSFLQALLRCDRTELDFFGFAPAPAVTAAGFLTDVQLLPHGRAVATMQGAQPAALPLGELIRLSFERPAEAGRTTPPISIESVHLVAPEGEGRILCPIADAGAPLALGPCDAVTRAGVPDPLAEPPGALRPFVRLDGRASLDPQGLTLTYRWQQTAGPAVALSEESSPIPTFLPPSAGLYAFALKVDNGVLESPLAATRVTVPPPGAEAVVQLRAFNLSRVEAAGPDDPPLEFTTGEERVRLEGQASGFPATAQLTYLWVQTAGPAVTLEPAADSATVELLPVVPGEYRFELAATAGASPSARASISIRAAAAAESGLHLSVVSSATTTGATGEALDADGAPGPRGSLRVRWPSDFQLEATVATTTPGGLGAVAPAVDWLQRGGPTASPTVELRSDGARLLSTARLSPRTAGVFEFECRVVKVEGRRQRVLRAARIRVVVEPPGLPGVRLAASAQVLQAGKTRRPRSPAAEPTWSWAEPGDLVTLRGGVSAQGSARSLELRWTQTEGPAVPLSNPFALETAFTAPALADGKPLRCAFILQAFEGPVQVDEPARVRVEVLPRVQLLLQLHRGPNLVCLPAEPLATAGAFTLADLARAVSSTFVAHCDEVGDRARFRVVTRDDTEAPPVLAGQAYLVCVPRAGTLTLPGRAWPETALRCRLPRGASFVGLPRGAPDGLTAESLCRLNGFEYLLDVDPGPLPGQPACFRLHVPGSPAPFTVRTGKGFLGFGKQTRSVTYPSP